jgi:hypothetical protein
MRRLLVLCFLLASLFPSKSGRAELASRETHKIACPAYYQLIPEDIMDRIIEYLSHQSYYAFDMSFAKACLVQRKIARDRAEEHSVIDAASDAQIAKRPELSVALLEQFLEKNDGDLTLVMLARLYDKGLGTTNNQEKAKHFFRLYYARLFPPDLSSPGECVKIFEKHAQYSETSLEIEQIKWFENLCRSGPKKIYETAKWYMGDKIKYRSPEIARHLLFPILGECRDCPANRLFQEAKEK